MEKNYTDIMVDLETLGNNSSPVIIQLSAVKFNSVTGETGETFNKLINPMSAVNKGLTINGSTVSWWLQQDEDVIKDVVVESILRGNDIEYVLIEFSKFLGQDDFRIWGNGIISDNVWINSAYKACGLESPVKYWQHSDVRTIVDLGRNLLGKDYKKDIEFIGDAHNAIDDCNHQIRYVCKIIDELKKDKKIETGSIDG